MSNTREKTLMITRMGIFTAIVIVLQLIAIGLARAGIFSVSLVLVPIVVASSLYGWKSGAWLGFVFGVVSLADAALFLAVSIPATIFVCLLKGTLAGIAAGLVFKLFEKKNRWAAILAAALACPVVNTGVFLLGCRLFFYEKVTEIALDNGFENVGLFMIVGFVGLNFLFELGLDLVLSPIILRLLNIVKKPAVQAQG